MKVLFLFTVNKSFLSDYFVTLAEHVARKGHEVIVFSWKQSSETTQRNSVTYKNSIKRGLLHQYSTIYSLIKNEQPNSIISNFSYVNPALLAAKLIGKRNSIAWQHSLIAQTKASSKQIYIKSKFLKWADTIVVNSTHLKTELENTFRLKEKNIKMLPFWTSIDTYQTKEIKLPSADFLIGCCGRLEVDKNQRILLDVLANLKNEVPNKSIKLVLAGEGNDTSFLKEKAASLSIEEEVVFLGLLSAQEMVGFYKAMDIIVLPSLHEAFGLTFIEALALDRPVMVSEAFGALTFINSDLFEVEKIVFKPDDVAALSRQIQIFISDKEISRIAYRELYEKTFSKENIQQQFNTILKIETAPTHAI